MSTSTKNLTSRLDKIEKELSRLKVHHAVVWLSEAMENRLKKIEDELKK